MVHFMMLARICWGEPFLTMKNPHFLKIVGISLFFLNTVFDLIMIKKSLINAQNIQLLEWFVQRTFWCCFLITILAQMLFHSKHWSFMVSRYSKYWFTFARNFFIIVDVLMKNNYNVVVFISLSLLFHIPLKEKAAFFANTIVIIVRWVLSLV